ncbi:flagellar basal body P-ring formation chaperone FlgA [Mesorhizobium sp. Z1-4]|uniref:flagellar basal body P-ring formation chaperone FlgA n=1 Tax=Mesorhizobium sp. Z1-4 TaxID=2448478 RepID=UPI000FD84559|nr:flagellar basal body P-ring formation chaperone FlgA [Mesorhizobium sp. Z1-4]
MALARWISLPIAAAILAASALMAFAQDTVVVPTRVVYPGELVTTADVQSVALRRSTAGLPPLAYDRSEVEGKVARRTLLPGRLIALSSLREAYAVEAGKPVQVQFVQGSLTISAVAVPLQPGSVGDLIRVRNIDSGVVFSGIIMADGTVRVGAT